MSVVIPAYNTRATLDLTLASLAAQDYPTSLMEVVVVDDGSDPAYKLPPLAPDNLSIVQPEDGWGRANACHVGAKHGQGEVILWLDADMILPADHVRRHLEWYDRVADVVTKGDILFVDKWDLTPQQVHGAVVGGSVPNLFPDSQVTRQWVEERYERTDELNTESSGIFTIYTGASASLSRSMYEQAGGLDTHLRLGEDSEFAYRLAQLGAVFIPARQAVGYHLGATNSQRRKQMVDKWDSPHFAQRAPLISGRRQTSGRQWSVSKLVCTVVIDPEAPLDARNCVNRLLQSSEDDLRVDLIGPWGRLHRERRSVLQDPTSDLYAMHEWYRGDGRVRLLEEAAVTPYPAPFGIAIPSTVAVSASSIEAMLRVLERRHLGVLKVLVDHEDGYDVVTVSRTAALERARRHSVNGDDLESIVEDIWGLWWAPGSDFGLHHLPLVERAEAGPRWRHSEGNEVHAMARLRSEIVELKNQIKVLESRT